MCGASSLHPAVDCWGVDVDPTPCERPLCCGLLLLLQLTAVEEQIRHFGQTPMQLFRCGVYCLPAYLPAACHFTPRHRRTESSLAAVVPLPPHTHTSAMPLPPPQAEAPAARRAPAALAAPAAQRARCDEAERGGAAPASQVSEHRLRVMVRRQRTGARNMQDNPKPLMLLQERRGGGGAAGAGGPGAAAARRPSRHVCWGVHVCVCGGGGGCFSMRSAASPLL